ncbi:hypothetical protein PIROE2DRAFT_12290 [Piromyces sp. E2]|nr:hypothetical protein PIROE2DRAFT_12290 [Piromyces sp. E2]|eukprot:OUM61648.1 hypothetical protein PIROE2DRAFT_12290 [Piromyces sp. E2]
MEKERLCQWKEYILPIYTDVPNKLKGEDDDKDNEKNSIKKKEPSNNNDNDDNNITKSKLFLVEDENEEDDNYLSINPRSIMVDDYLNYHNLNQDKLIQREEDDIKEKEDDYLFTDTSGDSNDPDANIKKYQDGMDISKQMDFKPYQYYHYHPHPHRHYHRHLSDSGSKSSEESNGDEYFHSNCELCQKMINDRRKEQRRSYSLSMKDLKKEMVDYFSLLLLDVDKVFYSNYDYIPLKILEYTRTYSIQEATMNNIYLSQQGDYQTNNDFQLTLSNTYTSLDFNNIKNVKLLHSNHLLDSAPLVSSSPTTITKDNKKDNIKEIPTKQEEWNCTVVNYSSNLP